MNESPMVVLCACSHTQRRHEDDGTGDHEGACKAGGCGCSEFRRAGKLEPALPGVVASPMRPVPTPAPVPKPATPLSELPADDDLELPDDDDRQVCSGCLDVVHALSSRNLCDGCEAEADAPAVVVGSPQSLEQWLDAGKRSPVRATVALTDRVMAQLADLRRRLEEEAVAAEARAEVDRLEEALAAARARAGQVRGRSGGVHAPRTYPRGEFPCPDEGCSEVKDTAQGITLHRIRAHGYRKSS